MRCSAAHGRAPSVSPCAGLLALGHEHGVATGEEHEPSDLDIAKRLMHTCYQMYRRCPPAAPSPPARLAPVPAASSPQVQTAQASQQQRQQAARRHSCGSAVSQLPARPRVCVGAQAASRAVARDRLLQALAGEPARGGLPKGARQRHRWWRLHSQAAGTQLANPQAASSRPRQLMQRVPPCN